MGWPVSLARRVQAPATMASVALLLVVASLLPLVFLATELLSASAAGALQRTLGTARPWWLLARTLALAVTVTLGALAVGVPMGAMLARANIAGRRVALLLHLFPVSLPPFLLAFGWFHLLGREGLVGSPMTSSLLFGPLGVVGTLTLAFAPIISALTVLGTDGVEPSLSEAARTAASPLRTLTHIVLPLAWPAIAFGALIVFALSLSEIGVPMFLRVRTYPAAVFARLAGVAQAPGEAAALVAPLLLIGIALLFIDRRLLGRRSFAALGLRSRHVAPAGRADLIPTALVWAVCALTVLPLVGLASEAGARGLLGVGAWLGPSLSTSRRVSACAASALVAAGLVTGPAVARGHRGAAPRDAVAFLTFLTPSAALALGLIATWNRPFSQGIYATPAILVVGLFARYVVVGGRTLGAVFHGSPRRYEDAAATFGAGYLRRLRHILVPMHWRGLLGAWLVAFVFCMRDLDTVVSFYPPGSEPLPVRIFTLEANGPEHVVAGLSLVQVAATAAVLLGVGLLSRQRA